jgi:hypothetical protein
VHLKSTYLLPFFLIFSIPVFAQTQYEAKLVPKDGEIHDLKFKYQYWPVKIGVHNYAHQAIVCLRGNYARDLWVLKFRGKPISKHHLGDPWFEACVLPIESEETRIVFDAYGPKGEVETRYYTLEVPHWQSFELRENIWYERYSLLKLGTLFASYAYSDSRSTFAGSALLVKLGFETRVIPPQIELLIDVLATAMPISSNDPNASAQFFNSNIRLGYAVTDLSSEARLSFFSGFRLVNVTATGGGFGVSGLIMPQFGTRLRAYSVRGSVFSVSIRYAPAFLLSSDVNGQEIGAQMDYDFIELLGLRVGLAFDFATLSYTEKDPITARQIGTGLFFRF